MDKQVFRHITYNKDELAEGEGRELDFAKAAQDGCIHWVDISDIEDVEGIKSLTQSFGIHRLIVEDILNVNEMVKVDNYDDCLFMVFKVLSINKNGNRIITEHISLLLKENCVISFQQFGGDVFKRVREKLLGGKDNIRKLGADYLCYELIDSVVDSYFDVVDEIGDITARIEEKLISRPEKNTLKQIYLIKRKLMYLRKSVFPLRELIGSLSGTKAGQLGGDVRIYFRDVYDHLIQIVDAIETYQDILSNMLDIYLSSVSNKTNETMKVLTIISTFFLPLSFLAGVYGMNFNNMPELSFKYGYLLFWLISAAVVVGMIAFFRKKKWF